MLVKENTMGVIGYILAHIYWSWLTCMFFMTNLFSPIISIRSGAFLTRQESVTVVLALMAGCIAIGIFTTIENHRNNLHLALNVLSPFGIYLILEMLPDMPDFFWYGMAGYLILVAYCAYMYISTPLKRPGRSGIWKRFCGFLHSSRFASNFLLAALMMACSTAAIFGTSVLDTGKERSYNASKNISYVLENHKIELLKMAPEQWENATLDEKAEVIQLILDIETAYLGLPDRVSVRTAKMDETTLGGYNHKNREILINQDHLMNDPSENCLDTALHEIYHSYQHQLCEAYEELSDRYRSLLHIRDASVYTYEFLNYISGKKDYVDYRLQDIEQDSREFASERSLMYRALLLAGEDDSP